MKNFLLLLIVFIYGTTLHSQDLNGKWVWTSKDGMDNFELRLEQDNNGMIRGTHCALFMNGENVDCTREQQGNFSLSVMKISPNVYAGTITSAQSRAEGKIRMVYNKRADFISFRLTSQPAGEFYLPEKAFLKRE